MRLALYQPDIPQNTGTLIRLGACLGTPIDIIEPCGFPLSDKSLKRAGMDYLEIANLTRHVSWETFRKTCGQNRLILLTTEAGHTYSEFEFRKTDVLMLGRESAGVPQEVHETVDARLTIPMASEARSLNVAVAGAMVLGEALRQTGGFPS